MARPRIYDTPEELQEAIEAYFEQNPERPTVSGMAVALGFADRSSMYDYAKDERFSYTIKHAISRIEAIHENRLFEPGSTGSIFWLKNRGWTDKSEIDHTTKGDKLPMPIWVGKSDE